MVAQALARGSIYRMAAAMAAELGYDRDRMAFERALVSLDRALGSGRVVTDLAIRESYAADESEAAPVVPDAVVRARDADDVAKVLRIANANGVPVTPRAGGTGRVGGAVPMHGGIVLAFEGMTRIKGIERTDQMVVVEPGVITGVLHRTVEAEGLFYPPDPNSFDGCCIGGNVAANAGGPRAFKYGVTRNYVLGMNAVLADGTALTLGRKTTKGVTGYDLVSLLVGSEGTLGVVTEVTLRLLPNPPSVATILAFFDDDRTIAHAVAALASARLVPRCLELLDAIALDLVRRDAGLALPPGTKAMLLVELDGDENALAVDLERAGNALTDLGALEVLVASKAGERERLWSARRELSRTLRKSARFKLSEDVVVPKSRLAELLARCRQLSETHRITMPTYGHAGDGNLHVNFLWNDPDDRPRVDAAIDGLFRAVIALDGTLSGEHGIGILKAPYLPLEQDETLIELQRRIKRTFDPNGILNPGKIFPGARRMHGAC